jgi:hypothetical protein
MPPKKDKAPKELTSFELPGIPEDLLVRHKPRWVQVHFKLVGFSSLNDIIRLPSSANLFMVEAKIIAHHGGSIVKLLSMWKDEVSPKHLLRDFSLTIKEIWKLNDEVARTIPDPNINAPSYALFNLGPKKQQGLEDHHVVVYYDYKAHESDDPLLLRSPRYRRIEEELNKQKEKQLQQQQQQQQQQAAKQQAAAAPTS